MSCNKCGRPLDQCECDNKCSIPCGCAEPVLSVEALSDDPLVLRFNFCGKSVTYDFSSVVKAGETCTSLTTNQPNRTLDYHGECGDYSISAKQLGNLLHLADLGDVDENSVEDNGILNYRKEGDCGEGCEGINNGWVSTNPVDVGVTALDYILGSDADGKMESLMPPTDTATFSYLAWAAGEKAMWKKPSQVTAAPTDDDGKKYPLYLDPKTGEIVALKEGS